MTVSFLNHSPLTENRSHRLRFEPLEDRRMLSVGGLDDASNQAVEVFHAQDALFAENAGQWQNEDAYFGYNKGGTQIYFTGESIEFGLSRRELKDGVDPAAIEGDWFSLPEECAAQTVPVPLSPELGLPDPTEEDFYETTSTHFSLNFDGAQPTVPTGADQAETVFNYHLGPQEDWVDGVATYKTIIYDDLYAGIDLHTFSRHGEMKYEFHVAPGANYSEIQLRYDDIEGLSVREDGSLEIETVLGEIVDEGLYIYQTIGGEQVEVAGEFTLVDTDTYTFTVTGNYDPSVELVIDPEVDWGTYLGGTRDDYANGVATDASGNVYVAGKTDSSGWISGGWDISRGGIQDGFVVKLSPTGSHLWSTYLGGESYDRADGVATDASGNIYVAGLTYSSGWVSGGWDAIHGGSDDGFIAKLSPDGSHLWSSYLGGTSTDIAESVATDATGNVYVTGETYSNGWVSDGWDTSLDGRGDGFVVKLSPTGSHLWSSYLGGASIERAELADGVATDASGNVYVAGETYSSGWVSGGWDTSLGGPYDGFVVKLSPAGSHLWSSYLGGADYECVYGVTTDTSGNVCLAGVTKSSGWVSGGWDTSLDGSDDGFVVKLSPAGSHLWSSYLGGANLDGARGVATDASENIYVAGETSSGGWISGGWDTSLGGPYDGFIVKLSPAGSHHWSSYFGGADSDGAADIATNGSGNVYVAGGTFSSGWISGDWDTSLDGIRDGFVVKIRESVPGDLNGDGQVDSADLDIVRANWGQAVPAGSLIDGDPSGDGFVGSADLDIVRANWQAWVSAAALEMSQDPASDSTPTPYGPHRAAISDAALAALPDSPTRRGLSDTDLAALAEAAWLREVKALQGRGGRRGTVSSKLREMAFWEG